MAYTINLKHRGPSVIAQIDLFDECHFGADKLFLRGDFGDFEGIKEQIAIALGDDSKLDKDKLKEMYGVEFDNDFKFHKLGIGNPLAKETSEEGKVTVPTIAMNRYHIPNKKFWNNVVPSDVENPYKASAAVKFSLRVYFRDDYAYIDFGCPWEFTSDFGGTLDADSLAEDFINNIVLFNCHFISKEDALKVLDTMFGNVSENTAELALMRVLPQYDIITTDIVDEEGNILS
jgi:hypothetical protein